MRSMIWRLLLASPFLVLLVLFVLSNSQPVQLGLWPTALRVDAPLSIAILVAMAIAFLLGALLTWTTGLGTRWRARRAEQAATALRAQLQAQNARMVPPVMPATTLLPPAAKR